MTRKKPDTFPRFLVNTRQFTGTLARPRIVRGSIMPPPVLPLADQRALLKGEGGEADDDGTRSKATCG